MSRNRKRPNRYNPNAPDYNAVHGSYLTRGFSRPAPIDVSFSLFGLLFAQRSLRAYKGRRGLR